MRYIDEKFKDRDPVETVEKIKGILDGLGISVFEKWSDSGVENCYSLSLTAKGGIPSANGKGVTKDFARASAYGEFIERLQGGLFFYKFQSIGRDADMDIQKFAPDAKYMTVAELEENGEWMDYIIETYKDKAISRKSIAEQCRVYACADDGRILTVPFYSIFEKKYVYLPMGFIDQMYATNGCCAGNTREEAWIHALSEMMERHASLDMLISGKSIPKIPEQILQKFPTVSKIIAQIRESGNCDVEIFDCSIGNGFPVISARIINKKSHSYHVNVAADPVLEIAIQRVLTETFQGRNIKNFTSKHSGKILGKVSDFSLVSNVINQLETGNGLFTADYFADEFTCEKTATDFADNSNETNKELFSYMLGLYRELGKPLYVRNFSYLGFPCYRFVVPGFSEALSVRLDEFISEYAIADGVSKTLKNPASASDEELNWFITYGKMISGTLGRYNRYGRISGIPIRGEQSFFLACLTRAYASYRLKRYGSAMKHMDAYIKSYGGDEELKDYFSCVNRYIELKMNGVSADKIKVILGKFYGESSVTRLYNSVDGGRTPYDEFLMKCDLENCTDCRYKDSCCYKNAKEINVKVAEVYRTFTEGQNESEFAI